MAAKKASRKGRPGQKPSSARSSGRATVELACDRCEHFKCSAAKDCFQGRAAARRQYEADPEALALARAAAEIEARYYGAATRVEEILHFARRINARHIGVAFCTGFKEEARVFCDLMRRAFRVSSVCCKNCSVPKSAFGMPHVRPVARESMCNPLGQADLLNAAGTDLNIVLGLCVGHDALFFQRSRAPTTVLAVKDRVLAHNPIGALYSPYIRRKLDEQVFPRTPGTEAPRRAGAQRPPPGPETSSSRT